MRKLDKLILKSFFGPFFLTTLVATFILLIQYLLKYFDDFVGKNLGVAVFGELLFYFSLNMLQVALPLGVLVSSLMTFGNLGEHFELTAIKSAGISLLRAMRPVFYVVLVLTVGAFFFNDYIVPAANLKAYSLLYDIKHQKPALDIKPGVFYHGLPGYTIKAADKLTDNMTLKNVMIYDHTRRDGNRNVILADSSKMYTIYNDKYLKLELFNGTYYSETAKAKSYVDDLNRTSFDRLDMVFSLSSFDLNRTKEELFRNNRQMKNLAELTYDIDSMSQEIRKIRELVVDGGVTYLFLHYKRHNDRKQNIDTVTVKNRETLEASVLPAFLWQDEGILHSLLADSVSPIRQIEVPHTRKMKKGGYQLDSLTMADLDSIVSDSRKRSMITQSALNSARNFKVNLSGMKMKRKNIEEEIDRYVIEKFKKYSQAFACIVMFLIGAPLGAIIKKGGLGMPVIVSIFFFIIYYVLTISSEKWAKANMMDGHLAVWVADLVLLPIGLFFLRQARIDARLFDYDFYLVALDKLMGKWKDRNVSKPANEE
ncbi:MAG: LptF/LptG family permease [Cyclobacteriaceae bacterium]|nr:LptF/LptG family permease [Cyclobacteriaceae bacterium]